MLLHVLAGLVAAAQLYLLTPHSGSPEVHSMIRDLNAGRQAAGLPALRIDEKLSLVAEQRATDMVTLKYFSHIQPDGRTPFDVMAEDGCSFRYAGENIAMAEDEREAMRALWNSLEHRENTLDTNYRKIGLAVATLADGSKVFVEDFSD